MLRSRTRCSKSLRLSARIQCCNLNVPPLVRGMLCTGCAGHVGNVASASSREKWVFRMRDTGTRCTPSRSVRVHMSGQGASDKKRFSLEICRTPLPEERTAESEGTSSVATPRGRGTVAFQHSSPMNAASATVQQTHDLPIVLSTPPSVDLRCCPSRAPSRVPACRWTCLAFRPPASSASSLFIILAPPKTRIQSSLMHGHTQRGSRRRRGLPGKRFFPATAHVRPRCTCCA